MVRGKQERQCWHRQLVSAHNIRSGLWVWIREAKRKYLPNCAPDWIPSQSHQVASTLLGCFAQEAWVLVARWLAMLIGWHTCFLFCRYEAMINGNIDDASFASLQDSNEKLCGFGLAAW